MKNIHLVALSAAGLCACSPLAWGAGQFSASDAKLSGENLSLNVMSPQVGWAVIHVENADGTPGDHIGHIHIKAGENDNLKIFLDQPVESKRLIVMLHKDEGKKGVFEFGANGKADAPVMQNGKPVIDRIVVSK